MKAIEIAAPGSADVLRLVDREVPEPGPGEVAIRVIAAGVNRPDLMQREGHYPPPPGVTDIPGLEVAGHITTLGPPLEGKPPQSALGRLWQLGDLVCALIAGGGYAEHCTAPGVQCLPVPAGVAPMDAAAIPETFFTVWTNVFERGRLAEGEWLLVHGGTSGIGTTAIQMARARGAHVIATAGNADKCRACEALGAVKAIDYRREDFAAAVKEFTDGRGVDVILDIVGGEYTARNVACLARDGRLVQIGLMGGGHATIPLGPLLMKRLTLTGSTLRSRSPQEKGAIAASLESDVWPLVESGDVKPIIDTRFPLSAAADAHRRLESGAVIGKIVLTLD